MTTTTSFNIKPIIGMEIHVQLATRTKLFCGCAVEFGAEPNTRLCPVCLGLPGALPVINRKAVDFAILLGTALNGEIAGYTKWDRKSYFYPDLPKNYQISQYDMPIASNGWFDFSHEDQSKRIRIRRAHLEEDAGKNMHEADGTLVDLNRAGTPLLEIVTEPDLTSADEAYAFATELQRLVTYLGISEGVMQKGQMRFEPNVNVRISHDNQEYRTPIAEIKNLNSFRVLRAAIQFEVDRQVKQWQENPDYIIGTAPNENRGWVDEREVTEFQRSKESAPDYRYFPDPDLMPVVISDGWKAEVRAALPELPLTRRRRLMQEAGLSLRDADVIIADRASADLFDVALSAGAPVKRLGNQYINVWSKLAADRQTTPAGLGVSAERMAELAKLVEAGTIGAGAAAQVAPEMIDSAESAESIAERLGLVQVRDVAQTEAWVREAVAANPKAVEDARNNPKKAKASEGFLRGQVMRLSGGKADPKLVGELISKYISQESG